MRADLDTRALNKLGATDPPARGIPDDPRGTRPERQLSREAYGLLAQANLLRMRGEWAESTDKCMAALRLSPDNPSAQSLLGDIYENQGRLDDAIQWYRMALDVQPDSPADQIKLARLLDLKARDLMTAQAPGNPPAVGSSPSPVPVLPARWRANPETLLRRFAFAAGALAVLVVCLALVLARSSGAFGTGGSPRSIDVAPVVVPSLATPPTPQQASPPAPSDADPAEASLLAALQASETLKDRGLSVASATVDPRVSRLTLTVSCQSLTGAALGRAEILTDATSALQAAAQQTDAASIAQFTIRCLAVPPAGGGTPLVFTADATRAALAALAPDLSLNTPAQIAGAYTSSWWASSLSQPS